MQETISQNMIQEDEIDLRELGRTIAKYKIKIALFASVVTVMSLVWALSKPNIYISKAVLVPQEQSKGASLGGLGALAGLAGVEVGGSGMMPDQAYQIYLDDYNWMRSFLIESKLYDRINASNADKNYRFALGYDGIYRFFKSTPATEEKSPKTIEKERYSTYLKVQNALSISSDAKTGVMTIVYTDPDGELAQKILNLFLAKASNDLRKTELIDLEKKIAYYDIELQKTTDIALKNQLSQLMSALIQKKVLAQSSEFYNVKMITTPQVPFEQDKEGPKRGLIVVVSFIASLIIGIFGILFIEFIRTKKED